jgi:hypothetical protein
MAESYYRSKNALKREGLWEIAAAISEEIRTLHGSRTGRAAQPVATQVVDLLFSLP